MKMLSLALLVCTIMALSTATAIRDQPVHVDPAVYPEEPFSVPPMTPEGPFMGGWQPSCPEGWVMPMSTIQCLLYVADSKTWTEAENNCQSLGGNLASVMDSQILSDIHELMKSASQKSGQIWVGGYNTAENPFWSWSDGMSYGFHDWCSGGDDNRKNHCAQVNLGVAPGCLEDRKCDTKLPSVCGILIM